MKRPELPRGKLSPAPPAPGALRVAKPAHRIQALQPEIRRSADQLATPRVSAEMVERMRQTEKR